MAVEKKKKSVKSDQVVQKTKPTIVAVGRTVEQVVQKPAIVAVGRTVEQVVGISKPEVVPVISPWDEVVKDKDSEQDKTKRKYPIPLPTKKNQYRAIGTVYAKLTVLDWGELSGELNFVLQPDIAPVRCVFLPMPLSLLRQLDLSQPYWWIVYPRFAKGQLYFQLSGVRSKLINPEVEEPDPYFDCRFWVRGSVTLQEEDHLLVKVRLNKKRSKPLRPSVCRYPSRLRLLGHVAEKMRGWFCDFSVVLCPDGLKLRKIRRFRKITKPNVLNPKKKNKPPSQPPEN